jgi:CRISPR/Cas system CMR subunit Cmr6 (Cas7 group RAMP superfamily)
MKSPSKDEDPQDKHLNLSGELSAFNKSDESIKKESEISLQNEKNSLKEKIMALKEAKKKKLRGIKTTMRIVDTYLTEVFKKVKDSEDEFVENLSTPLNKDPLEILLHLQNVCLEQEFDNAVAF